MYKLTLAQQMLFVINHFVHAQLDKVNSLSERTHLCRNMPMEV